MAMKRSFFLITLSLLTVLTCLPLSGMEQILSFDSHITVDSSGSMDVTEKITVISEGDRIKHGIYRDFPTKYKDRYGNLYVVDFQLIDVRRDERTDNYRTEHRQNGIRIYIGDKNLLLPSEKHEYLIRYRTARQLGFFNGYDELYWNVTGNGWEFPIKNASATVKLPSDAAKHLKWYGGYTGYAQSRESNYTSEVNTDGKVHFSAARQLNEKEGLTIFAAWPAGYVTRPDINTKFNYFLKDNRELFASLTGLAVVLIYYLLVWSKAGKDPEKGTIIPLYSPPDSLSPAAMRYITKMKFDSKAFAAAIINTAVKGAVVIKDVDGRYDIARTEKIDAALTEEESKLLDTLIGPGSHRSITLRNENHTEIKAAMNYLENSLKSAYEKTYFITNSGYFSWGVAISIVAMLCCVAFLPLSNLPAALFMTVWLTGWSFGVVMLVIKTVSAWQAAVRSSGFKKLTGAGGAVFITLFSLPFVAGECAGIYFLWQFTSAGIILMLGFIVLANLLFYHLLKAPTLLGRKVLDRIEGFKMYLTVAEKDRLNVLMPPEKSVKTFEKYLPYALALDVEQQWSEYFADVLAAAGTEEKRYSPAWYSGGSYAAFTGAGFASSLGSAFTGAISSSSTPPGSSGGSGGW
jgi:hypothetical protein